jgi:tRNA 5-methylaminomethyl-2-thiouridine biosynthesis bifunctional protein
MRGLLSGGLHADATATRQPFAPFPVNGSGSAIPHIPVAGENRWFVGSSYQPETQAERSDADNHARNFDHLQQLLPTLANELETNFSQHRVTHWKGVRCIMADRLPVVGPLDGGSQPSLWICAGLGSRGMSFSVLCAELLAARMGAEPLPVETSLAKALNALRA